MLHRLAVLSASTLAALTLAAGAASAQDDDDNGDDDNGAVPQQGVQTGGGGTAEEGPAGILLGLGAGTLVLVATAGGMTLRRRHQE